MEIPLTVPMKRREWEDSRESKLKDFTLIQTRHLIVCEPQQPIVLFNAKALRQQLLEVP